MGTSNRRINEKDLLFSKPKNPTEHLIMYCKLLKYLRIREERRYRIAYRHRILSTDNIETIFGPGDIEWYKVYTDSRCNNYYISVRQVSAIKL